MTKELADESFVALLDSGILRLSQSLANLKINERYMLNELFIRMPYLHPALNNGIQEAHLCKFPNLRYFWPGHAEPDTSIPCWQAENLPMSRAEASALLASLKGRDLRDMERIRLLMQQRLHEEDRRFRAEMSDLENFLASPDSPAGGSRPDPPLRQIQMNILWLWLLEEEYLEISSLTRNCIQAEAELLAKVHDGAEKRLPPPSSLSISKDLLPDWKKIFLNTAFFINPELNVLLEGSMKDDLLSEFPFTKVMENSESDFILASVALPLWMILGQPRRKHDSPFMDRVWNTPRSLFALLEK